MSGAELVLTLFFFGGIISLAALVTRKIEDQRLQWTKGSIFTCFLGLGVMFVSVLMTNLGVAEEVATKVSTLWGR